MIERNVSRIILLDTQASILLVSYCRITPHGKNEVFWVTPGGGVENEESFYEAAKRELKEETSLNIEIGPLVFTTEMKFKLDHKTILSKEKFFLAKSDLIKPHVSNQDSNETISEFKWWKYNDLIESNITLYPESLLKNLKNVISGHIPEKPIAI
jgi:ADP-ribose pyrophosphatase YjhB (NUDIX family)